VVRYFDASPRLWLSSVGISGIIGTALYLSTARAGTVALRLGAWPVFRFYLMPFCVSSFAALIKGRQFFLVFHPDLQSNALMLGWCAAFVALVYAIKWMAKPPSTGAQSAVRPVVGTRFTG
jgi:hypothetical protein